MSILYVNLGNKETLFLVVRGTESFLRKPHNTTYFLKKKIMILSDVDTAATLTLQWREVR